MVQSGFSIEPLPAAEREAQGVRPKREQAVGAAGEDGHDAQEALTRSGALPAEGIK